MARNRDEGSYRLSHTYDQFPATLHLYLVARTGRRTEQASSDEGLWYRPKHQGKNVWLCSSNSLKKLIQKKQTWLKLFLLHDGGPITFAVVKADTF